MADRTRGTYGYYRQPDGFITAASATNTDELKYRRGGWEPLLQYGNFEMSTPYMVSHPLEPLFIRGGERELTVRQIVEQGLYMEPPVIPSCRQTLDQMHKHHEPSCFRNTKSVEFPQLDGVAVGPFPCAFGCGRLSPTKEAAEQHAGVMHKPEKSDERTGESLAAALLLGFGGTAVAPTTAPTATTPGAVDVSSILAAMETMQREIAALRAHETPARHRVNPGAIRHNHKGPWDRIHEDCPRCRETAVPA